MTRVLRSIYIPCEILPVRAIIAPSDGVTPLVRLMLEAIWRGDGRLLLDDLVGMFGIGYRPTLDLVHDLWSAGNLAVDTSTGALYVTAATRRLLEDDTHELPSVRRSEVDLPVLRELVTGHFLPARRLAGEVRRGFTAPAVLDPTAGKLTDDESAELLELARRLVPRTLGGEQQVVHDVIPADTAARGVRRTVIQVRAHVEQHEMEGLLFDIVKPITIADHVRRAIGDRLQTLAQESPGLHIFKNLAAKVASAAGSQVDSIERALARLDDACGDLARGGRDTAMTLHRACEAAARDVLAIIRDDVSHTATVDVLAGTETFNRAVRNAIAQARNQLVLVCPFVDSSDAAVLAYERYTEDLLHVMRVHGVRVVVLWGIEHQKAIDPRFANWLALLQADSRNGVVVRAVESARLHAKAVICDGHLAIVGSVNFLNKRGTDGIELGLVVRSGDDAPSPVVVDLLQWARRVAPTADVSSAIEVPMPPQPASVGLPTPAEPEATRRPDAPYGEAEMALQHCREAWEQFRLEVVALFGRWRSVCRVAEDADNRRLLLRAIRRARWRLLIASDRLSEEAFDASVRRMLVARFAEGLPVALVWQGRPDESAGIEAKIAELGAEYPGTLTLVKTNNHAKVVVCDEDVLVSSFNFLSFQGDYETVRGARGPRELGIHVAAGEAADGVVKGLLEQIGGGGELDQWVAACEHRRNAVEHPIAGEAEAATLAARAVDDGTMLQELLSDLARANEEEARNRIIRTFFERVSEPARALESLLSLGMVPRDARTATLCAIRRSEARSHSHYGLWVSDVARDLWLERRFFEASALLALLGDLETSGIPHTLSVLEELPTLRIAFLAAVGEDERAFRYRLEDMLTDSEATVFERNCAFALTVLALLQHGWFDVGQVAMDFSPAAEVGVGGQLLDAYLEGWWTLAPGLPLPLSTIRQLVARQDIEVGLAAHQQVLIDTFDHAIHVQFPSFEPGERTLKGIFAGGGALHPLLEAVGAGDVAEVRRQIELLGTADEIVDRVWAKLPDRPRKRLGKPFRPAIVRPTVAAIEAARSWLYASGDGAPVLHQMEIAALTKLREKLESVVQDLEVIETRDAAGPVLQACLELLEPLLAWRPPAQENFRAVQTSTADGQYEHLS